MATLGNDKVRQFRNVAPAIELPVRAADIIYRGAAVAEDTATGNVGLCEPLAAGGVFLGFADAKADNSAGAASAVGVSVIPSGEVLLSVTNVTSAADVNLTVYASDDDTFTTASTNNSAVGKIVQWVSGTNAWVYFEGAPQRSI
jgi:hypothetical protein